jgi:hypothetical protein
MKCLFKPACESTSAQQPPCSSFGTASMPLPSTLDCRRSTSLPSSFSGKLCKSLAVSLAVNSFHPPLAPLPSYWAPTFSPSHLPTLYCPLLFALDARLLRSLPKIPSANFYIPRPRRSLRRSFVVETAVCRTPFLLCRNCNT